MKRLIPTLTFLGIAWTTSCATPGSQTPPGKASAGSPDSAIEIVYRLGHTHRRLWLESKADQAQGRNFLDRNLLQESRIEPARYKEFLSKASELIARMSERARHPAQADPECRNPVTLTVRIGVETRKWETCRTRDEGALSRLIRDGEFLLVARK